MSERNKNYARRDSGKDNTDRDEKKSRRSRRPRTPKSAIDSADYPVRLNRYIARSGICSRRGADDLIRTGKVSLNGDKVDTMGTMVSATDIVTIGGKRLVPPDLVYILANKPAGLITTVSDEKDRQTVMSLLPVDSPRFKGVFPVGRLDRATTGALVLTNDGTLAHRLMHPRYEIEKRYLVETKRTVTEDEIQVLRKGVQLEDGLARADKILSLENSDQKTIAIEIHEGRNRQIRRMIEAIGHEVTKLERVQYAGLRVKGIRRGKWRLLEKSEIEALYRKVKL